jgi:F-type H+-transporting ATPase subunit b
MEATLNALGGILLNAIPTFVLIIFLHFYLKSVFFQPLEKVLQERDEATAGARKRAEESLRVAEEKARQHEQVLRDARGAVYNEQEEQRKKLLAEQSAQIAEAASKTKALVAAAREQLAAETAVAKKTLESESGQTATKIVDSILAGRAA